MVVGVILLLEFEVDFDIIIELLWLCFVLVYFSDVGIFYVVFVVIDWFLKVCWFVMVFEVFGVLDVCVWYGLRWLECKVVLGMVFEMLFVFEKLGEE